MTAPVRHSRSSRTSAVDEQLTITLPATNPGDVVEIWWVGDGVNTGMQDVCGQFVGWNRERISNSGVTMCYGRLFKVDVDGSLGGQTLTMSTPNEKWCVEAGAISGAHVDGDLLYTWATGSSTTPDPPSEGGYSGGPWDALFSAVAVSDGSGIFSGVPSGYTSVASLNNAAADGVALALADKTGSDGASEDPTAFAKSSASAWAATTHLFIAPISPEGTAAAIQSERAEVLTGSTLDFTVEVASEFFCCALENATLAQTTSLVLDPGGPNERTLALCTDGVNNAAVGGGAGTIAWRQLDPDNMPPPGAYTLRATLTTSLTCGLFSFNVTDGNEIVDVLNDSSATSATGTVDTQTGDLVLVAAGQVANAPGGVPKQGEPWATRTIGTTALWPRLSAWYATDYVTVFARRVRAPATSTITIAATTVNLSAIVIRYRPRPPLNPIFFGGF